MRYADEQIIRPREEGGAVYTYTRRVLARNGQLFLLFEDGHHYRKEYFAASLTKFRAAGGTRISHTIFEGTITPAKLREHAQAIQDAMGVEFDVSLLRRDLTLLLDEPGEVTAPPLRARVIKDKQPSLVGQLLYAVRDIDTDRGIAWKVVTYKVIKQREHRIVLVRLFPDGSQAIMERSGSLAEIGTEYHTEQEAAVEAWVNQFAAKSHQAMKDHDEAYARVKETGRALNWAIAAAKTLRNAHEIVQPYRHTTEEPDGEENGDDTQAR